MKIAVVKKSDKEIKTWYESSAVDYSHFARDWGNPKKVVHIPLPENMDSRKVKAVQNGENWSLIEDEIKSAEIDLQNIKASLRAAMAKGNEVIENFATENILLGITQDGKTGHVLNVMSPIMDALRSGSLHEAIARMKAVKTADKDPKYITEPRLLAAINELEAFLGIPLTPDI